MYEKHITSQIRHGGLRSHNVLHVIGVLYNPMRYHSRYRLFRRWLAEMEATPHVKVYVVEVAFGDREFECSDSENPCHLQLRAKQEIWHKESLINLAVKHLLPRDWKYLCWSDTDVSWLDRGWAQEALHQLQHYALIQPWQDCLDLGFHGTVLQHFKSFCYQDRRKVKKQRHPGEPYEYAHSGFAWCCRRDWWEAVVKLMDFPILGSADHHMAWASINEVMSSVHGGMHENFKRLAKEWQARSYRATQGQIGFVPCVINHHFHGPKHRRQYRERWQIFIDHKFDPVTDLTYDEQGLVQLIGKPELLQATRDYLSFRNEDSTDNY